MDEVLKNRLTGALVIGLALVIFFPLWLDGENVAALGGEVPQSSIPELSMPPVPRLEPMDVPNVPTDIVEANKDIDAEHRVDLNQVETQLSEVFSFDDGAQDSTENSDAPEDLATQDSKSEDSTTNVSVLSSSAPKDVTVAKPEPKSVYVKPIVDSRKVAWSIQVASFNESGSVNRLKDKLRKKNFSPYSRNFTKKDGSKGYRVYVGPIIQKEEAKRLQKELHKALGINDTFILRYKT